MANTLTAESRNPLRVYLDIPGLVRRQSLRTLRGLQAGAEHRARNVLLLVLALSGVIGDGATTLIAIYSGRGAEANPAVLAVGGIIGLDIWLLATAAIASLFALPLLGRPDHPYGYVISAGCAVFLLSKVILTLSNFLVIIGQPSIL